MMTQIIDNIKKLMTGKLQLVVAIDGMSASGKSTLAERLEFQLGAEIIHMDDFFLPQNLRTEERLKEAGGNVHYERFETEVASKIQRMRPFEYGVFDCGRMEITEYKRIENNKKVIVVEGAYSMRPEFLGLYDYKIFMKTAPKTQLKRITERNGDEMAKRFEAQWIPMENAYFKAFDVEKSADIVIET